jgi:hypothetical protein
LLGVGIPGKEEIEQIKNTVMIMNYDEAIKVMDKLAPLKVH